MTYLEREQKSRGSTLMIDDRSIRIIHSETRLRTRRRWRVFTCPALEIHARRDPVRTVNTVSEC